MTAPKPRRISREEAITILAVRIVGSEATRFESALRMAIRALKREQKAADAKKKKETKR